MSSQRHIRNLKIARLDKLRASLLAMCWALLLGGGASMISQVAIDGSFNRSLVVALAAMAFASLSAAQFVWKQQAQMLTAAQKSNGLKIASQTSFS